LDALILALARRAILEDVFDADQLLQVATYLAVDFYMLSAIKVLAFF
jgi:hypothetical protein|tara:strand:+ start:75 stop:215 length:141 start_codon:yes stop_codon:yes gene_type:complete